MLKLTDRALSVYYFMSTQWIRELLTRVQLSGNYRTSLDESSAKRRVKLEGRLYIGFLRYPIKPYTSGRLVPMGSNICWKFIDFI